MGSLRPRQAALNLPRAYRAAEPRAAKAADVLEQLGRELEAAGSHVHAGPDRTATAAFSRRGSRSAEGSTFDLLLAEQYSEVERAVFEGYLASLVRRRQLTRAAIDRRRNGDDAGEEHEADDHLLRCADSKSLSSEDRLNALWGDESAPETGARGLVERLSRSHLQELLLDLLMPREKLLFRFQDDQGSSNGGGEESETPPDLEAWPFPQTPLTPKHDQSPGVTVERALASSNLLTPAMLDAALEAENGKTAAALAYSAQEAGGREGRREGRREGGKDGGREGAGLELENTQHQWSRRQHLEAVLATLLHERHQVCESVSGVSEGVRDVGSQSADGRADE